MKKLHFITLAAAAALTAACSSTETVYEYVRLSDAACTFLASDNTQKSIEVTASGAWQADAGASWLTVERQDDYLLLAAADNDSGMERVTEIVITSGSATAGIKVIQMAPESTIYRYRVLKTFDMGAVMSKNGRYVGGNIKELLPVETWENYPTIIDLETDEWIQRSLSQQSLQHRTALRHLRRRDDILPGCQHQRMRRLQPRGRLLSARQCRGARTPALGTEHLGRRPHLGRLGAG